MADTATVVADETIPPPSDEATSLSDNPDLFKLPLQEAPQEGSKEQQKVETAPTPIESEKQEASPKAVPTVPEPNKISEKSQEDFKPTYEGAKPSEVPFKSKEADEIRQAPPPKGIHAKNWNEAKEKWAGIVEAKDQALHKAQKEHQEASAALVRKNEELEKRISSLVGYESVIDYQASDKFKKEIEEPLSRAETSMIDWAKGWATPDGIKELTEKIKDDGYLDQALIELQKSRPDVALRFQMHMGKVLDLRERRNAALSEVKANHQKFVDERRSESATKAAQFETGIKSAIEAHSRMFNGNEPSFPFLTKMQLPSGADQRTQSIVEQHNKQVEENLRDLEAVVKSEDPSQRVRMAVGYMTAVVQLQTIKQLQEENKKLHSEIDGFKEKSAIPVKASGGVAPTKQEVPEMPLSEYFDKQYGRNQ